jgi:hypothetical protein
VLNVQKKMSYEAYEGVTVSINARVVEVRAGLASPTPCPASDCRASVWPSLGLSSPPTFAGASLYSHTIRSRSHLVPWCCRFVCVGDRTPWQPEA